MSTSANSIGPLRPDKPRLLIFCGIPGSGKTTIASLVAARLPLCLHVQTDQVRAMVSRPAYTGSESRFVYAAAIAIAGEALKHDYDAIVDGTFPKEEFRREAVSRLSRLSGSTQVVHVVCDIETALLRNAERKDRVPDDTILRIARTFEVPEGALVLDSGKIEPILAVDAVLAALSSA